MSSKTLEELNLITERIIGAAIRVHSEIGPGLLESAYQTCFAIELNHQGVRFEREKKLPLKYRGVPVETGYRLDFVVEDEVIVELKAVQTLEPIHRAQLLSYLKMSGYKLGLLINFNVSLLKDGIVRIIN